MTRMPAVASQFYPGDAGTLAKTVEKLIPPTGPARQQALAVMAPHAGYIYSGGVAGETFGRVEIPEDVLLLGPNHHGYGSPAALMHEGAWQMPMGGVPLNPELGQLLLAKSPHIREDEAAHRLEHSLEVQVPFLQYLQKNLRLTPLVLSSLSFPVCEEIGRSLAAAITAYGRPVLLVASSDMTHYESRQAASAKDHLALERILALDPAGLYQTVAGRRISMCGVLPTTVALVAALGLGASRAELVRYTDSGEASGDTLQVVGYAGVIIS